MCGTQWKDLLTNLGCLADGRFICPPEFREVTIAVSAYGGGVHLTIQHTARAEPSEWAYTDDFIIHEDGRGHTAYYDWDGMVAVFTNPI